MKILKPLRLGAMTRVYEVGTQPYLVVTSLAFFPLDAPGVLLGEQSMWRTLTAQLGMTQPPLDEVVEGGAVDASVGVLDEGLPKPAAEVLLRGFAFPPSPPQPGCSVRLSLGHEGKKVDRTLKVFGDRRWEFLGMTMPEPFEKMPLGWSRAFGGAGFATNPVGRGAAPTKGPDGKPVHWLPNVEQPGHLVKAKGDRPSPASFAPVDASWPQRVSKLGTFDQKWLETHYPGMPTDMDLAAFASAPEGQRFEGFLEGGEPFLLENVHPTRPRIEGALPRLRAVAFYKKRGDDALHEIPMRLDTVQFFPHVERGLLSFRGLVAVGEDDAWDVTHLMLGAERASQPRGLEHYQAVFATRTDPEAGALAAIVDEDLLPEIPPFVGGVEDSADDVDHFVRRDRLLERNQAGRAAREHGLMMEEVTKAGLDPVKMGLPPDPPLQELLAPTPTPEQAVRILKDGAKEMEEEEVVVERRRKAADARARELCASHGVDYEQLMGGEDTGGPPKLSAAAEVARMRSGLALAKSVGVDLVELEARLDDPEFEAGLKERELQLRDLYRISAHLMPRAPLPDREAARILGGRVIAAHAGEVAMADQDLTGADLARTDLAGVDLAFAFLERADLEGARLTGARLEKTVLARANLRGADLSGADLRGANLGEADLTDTDLSGADLSGAILYRARLHRTRLVGAKMVQVDVWEARLSEAILDGAQLEKANFVQATLEKVRANGARLRDVHFMDSEVHGLDLAGAEVAELNFVASRGDGCSFRGAKLTGLRMVGESSFPGADFTDASLPAASLRGTNLEGASFAGADLQAADLSECRAMNADFRRAIATGAMFVRTDLRGADLSEAKLLDVIAHKANLAGAKLTSGNLFQADLAGARGDADTSFSGSNLGRVRRTRGSV